MTVDITGFERRRREAAAEAAPTPTEQEIEAARLAAEAAEAATKPFDEMTKAELTKYASDKNIDLGKAKTNAEIIAVIEQHEKG